MNTVLIPIDCSRYALTLTRWSGMPKIKETALVMFMTCGTASSFTV